MGASKRMRVYIFLHTIGEILDSPAYDLMEEGGGGEWAPRMAQRWSGEQCSLDPRAHIEAPQRWPAAVQLARARTPPRMAS
jgi:hypothetical protein